MRQTGEGAAPVAGSSAIAEPFVAHGAPARDHARQTADEAALRFARRKRLGPYAATPPDRRDSDKALAAMIRAGHSFELAKRILSLPVEFDAEP